MVVGLSVAVAIETLVVHLWLRAYRPSLAWLLTVGSLSAIAWLAADYRTLGRGVIRVDHTGLDIRVGRRAAVRVPLHALAAVVQPTWREVPAPGERGSADYRNLMKPATPNVLVSVTTPVIVRLPGGITRSVQRIGLRLDDPTGFIAAVDTARRSSASSRAI